MNNRNVFLIERKRDRCIDREIEVLDREKAVIFAYNNATFEEDREMSSTRGNSRKFVCSRFPSVPATLERVSW